MTSELASLGRQDGAHLFAVFEKMFEADGNSPAGAKFDVFDAWYKLQILECELRFHKAGVADDQIKVWQESCLDEMQRRLGILREQMARVH